MENQPVWVNCRNLIDGVPEDLLIKPVPPEQLTADSHQRFIRDCFALAVGFAFLNKGWAGPSGNTVVQDAFEMLTAGWAKDNAGEGIVLSPLL